MAAPTRGVRVGVAAAVLIVGGCRGSRTPTRAGPCPPGFPTASVRFGADSVAAVAALVGDFEVVSVRTTAGLPVDISRGRLALRPSPPGERRYRPALAPATEREQPLTGAFRAEGDSARGHRAAVWRLRRHALLSDTFSCLDCGTSSYAIERVGTDGFAGTWSASLGGVYLVGPGGRVYGELGGHFCARRVPARGGAGGASHRATVRRRHVQGGADLVVEREVSVR